MNEATERQRARLHESRLKRAAQEPVVPGLPEIPGIRVAMELTPALGEHLRGLANALLVDDFPGSTLDRYQRELIATAVSAENNTFFCMDSHAAHAAAVAELQGMDVDAEAQTDAVKLGDYDELDPKMQALLRVADAVNQLDAREQQASAVAASLEAGATEGDVQLTVAIAAGFAMFNRLVDGYRARTPANTAVYGERAGAIALHGYGPAPRA